MNNLHTMLYESFTDEQFIILKVDQELRDKAHSQYCFELIKRLQPYALYGHKFIFKKVKNKSVQKDVPKFIYNSVVFLSSLEVE
ncbi:hypothetical protein [Acinetobacter lactucae]|nr:hypothetical protein [Acinetobacter lactucae]